jgi:arabinose-5-phosphate isomerase
MKYAERAREILDIELAGLQRVRERLGPEFGRAVRLLLERLGAGGKIVLTGLGKSFHIAQKIAATMTSTGTPAVVLHPSEAMHGDLGILHSNDALLALSFTGESEELLKLVPLVKRLGLPIISLTGDPKSALARHSDEIIPVPIEREACPFNMAPTTSTTATLALGDALAIVLLEARGFNKEDYAKLHPGGAIGRTLLVRVADIMRTGERVARVRQGAKVKDAVLAMTSARAGAVAVVDEHDKLLGIFTDGDLRRHITDGVNLAESPVDGLMTTHPISLTAEHLAVDVLALFEKYNIDDLVVVDKKKRLVGMVDIQDLPKLKIL